MTRSCTTTLLTSFLLLFSTHGYGQKVLMLGDSLTAGYKIDKEVAYPALIEKELKASGYPNITVVNAGISGSTTASGTQRLTWHLRSKPKPRVMVLALGANDGLRGLKLEKSKENLIATIQLAKKNNIVVILAGMKIPTNYGAVYTNAFAKLYTEIAKQEKIALIPFLLEGVATIKKLNLSDGIHPNEEGHKILAKTVTSYLVPILKELK